MLTRNPNASSAAKLARRRQQFQKKLDAFWDDMPLALSNILPEGQSWSSILQLDAICNPLEKGEGENDTMDEDALDDPCDEEDYTEDELDHPTKTPGHMSSPENIMLPLPSRLGPEIHQDQTIATLLEEELKVRECQASEALEQVRLSLGVKSAIFRKKLRNAKSQQTKTRAWKAVHVASSAVQQHARSYALAQHALVALHADARTLQRFPAMSQGDLVVSRDVVEENRIGQRSEHISWIWRLDIGNDLDEDTWMEESEWDYFAAIENSVMMDLVTRVNWLRAKARTERWQEEVLILQHEMVWTERWFEHQMNEWGKRMHPNDESKLGHQAYAAKQASIWKHFRDHAQREFSTVVRAA
jgi:hypothetical protein